MDNSMKASYRSKNDFRRRATPEKIRAMAELHENKRCPYNMRFKIQGCLLLRDRGIEDLFKLLERCRDEEKDTPCMSGEAG